MKLQGIVETDFKFSIVLIHFGEKDGADFGQISFPDIGDMNIDLDEITITDSEVDLLIILNGMPCKAHMENHAGQWKGKMDMDSVPLHETLTITQISEEPGFAEHHYVIPEENINALRTHADFNREKCDGRLSYELHNKEVLNYLKEKGIDVKNRHDFSTICNLMKQTCKLILTDGVNYNHDRKNRGTIAEWTFAEKQDHYTNCRGIAIILTGVLRAYGFCANVVECWPVKEDQTDMHVVCEVYAEDLNKAVLVDPSNNLVYFLDGQPLSLIELRQALIDGREQEITINEDASFRGHPVSVTEMLAYMSKNLVYLRKTLRSNETEEMVEENSITLAPRDLLADEYPKSTVYTCNIEEFYAVKENEMLPGKY